jgi:hypothetical protein
MREMVDDQTANQAASPLKKGGRGRKENHQFWSSRIAVLVVLMLVL